MAGVVRVVEPARVSASNWSARIPGGAASMACFSASWTRECCLRGRTPIGPTATVAHESPRYPATRGAKSHRTSSSARSARPLGEPPRAAVRGPPTRSASTGTRAPTCVSIAACTLENSSVSVIPTRTSWRNARCPASTAAIAARRSATSSGSFTARSRASGPSAARHVTPSASANGKRLGLNRNHAPPDKLLQDSRRCGYSDERPAPGTW